MSYSPREKARLDLGLCIRCGEDDALSGIMRCAACRDSCNASKRRLYAQRRRQGVVYTEQAKAEMREFANKLRESRRDAGKCVQCGDSVSRFTRCNKCRQKMAVLSLRFWHKKNSLAEAA